VPTLYHAARYWDAPHPTAGWANLEHAVRTGGGWPSKTCNTCQPGLLEAHRDEAERFDLHAARPDDRQAAVAAAYDFTGAQPGSSTSAGEMGHCWARSSDGTRGSWPAV
jgi:hypothetical protein